MATDVTDVQVGEVSDYVIIALDPEGLIRSWNAGAARVKGYTAQEALGRPFTIFYTEEDRRSALPQWLLGQAAAEGSVNHVGWRVRQDGSRFWGDVTLTARHDDRGRLTGFVKVTRDTTEQHDLEVSLRESEERYRLLVDQVVDYAIVALDPDGVVESWNAGAERLTGYPAAHAVGRSFSTSFTEAERSDGLPERLLRLAREQGHVERSMWRLRHGADPWWADVVLTAVCDDDGHLRGYTEVTRDITAVKREADVQDSFYRAFDHDFRTPVTVIKGFASTLLEQDLPPERRTHLLTRIGASADRLLMMTESLLDHARLRRLQMSLDRAPTDLVVVSTEVVAELGEVLGARPVSVVGACPAVLADPVATHRVLTNLVVNAHRYSPPAAPLLLVAACDDTTYGHLTVVDRGRGIAESDLSTIFEEFQRGRFAEPDGGLGLGLASAHKLVRSMGGALTIRSVLGEGTSVRVALPLAAG